MVWLGLVVDVRVPEQVQRGESDAARRSGRYLGENGWYTRSSRGRGRDQGRGMDIWIQCIHLNCLLAANLNCCRTRHRAWAPHPRLAGKFLAQQRQSHAHVPAVHQKMDREHAATGPNRARRQPPHVRRKIGPRRRVPQHLGHGVSNTNARIYNNINIILIYININNGF